MMLIALTVLLLTARVHHSLVSCWSCCISQEKVRAKKLKAGVLIGLIVAMPFVITTIIFKQGNVEEVLSMTGRLPSGKHCWQRGLPKEPLFGFGYMRIAYKDYFQSVHTYAGQMTHNTFIQVLMNLGIVGLLLVLVQLFLTIRGFMLTKDLSKKTFCRFVYSYSHQFIYRVRYFRWNKLWYFVLSAAHFYGIMHINEHLSRREKALQNPGIRTRLLQKSQLRIPFWDLLPILRHTYFRTILLIQKDHKFRWHDLRLWRATLNLVMTKFQTSDLSILLRLFSVEGRKVLFFAGDRGIDRSGNFPIHVFHETDSIPAADHAVWLVSDSSFIRRFGHAVKFDQIILFSSTAKPTGWFSSAFVPRNLQSGSDLALDLSYGSSSSDILNLYNAGTWKADCTKNLWSYHSRLDCVRFHLQCPSAFTVAAILRSEYFARRPRSNTAFYRNDWYQQKMYCWSQYTGEEPVISSKSRWTVIPVCWSETKSKCWTRWRIPDLKVWQHRACCRWRDGCGSGGKY